MAAQISAYGRLAADPQTRTTANGKSMAMARLAVALPCHTAQNNEATYWLALWLSAHRLTHWRDTQRAT